MLISNSLFFIESRLTNLWNIETEDYTNFYGMELRDERGLAAMNLNPVFENMELERTKEAKLRKSTTSVEIPKWALTPITCKKCKNSFSRMDSLRRHEKSYCKVKKENETAYTCAFCKQKLSTERLYANHLLVVHSIRDYEFQS